MKLIGFVSLSVFLPISLAAFINGQNLNLQTANLSKRGLIRDIIDNICYSNCTGFPHDANCDEDDRIAFVSETVTTSGPDSVVTSPITNLRAQVRAKRTRMKLHTLMDETLELKKEFKSRDYYRGLALDRKHGELNRITREWNKVSQKYQDISREDWDNLALWSKPKDHAALRRFHDDLYEQLVHVRAFVLDYLRIYEREKRTSRIHTEEATEATSGVPTEVATVPGLDTATEALEESKGTPEEAQGHEETPRVRLYRLAYFPSFDMWHSPLY